MMFLLDHERRINLEKNCPFCGSDELKTFNEDYYNEKMKDAGAVIIKCMNCSCSLWNFPHQEMNYNDALTLAVTKWNRRAS